ncbi:MAG TPA: protein kinase [Blastocatellia bacterium]|nr:protein kinase [Blastocatellia bacterium]
MIGQIIGTFRIEQKIGEGGMGAVFRGHDLMLEREVAIKALRPELARQPELVARFRSEAVTLAKLNHSHIATLYNFLRHGEDYFMVMEFVRGKTLDESLRQSGAMDIERAVRLFCQALEGIAHAHALGVIHRDIKPANLMLTANDEVKVMDFGIARVLGTARQTKTGRLIGTLEYMSPEQMRGAETDARSDIYSLGILLYEMLTGRVPFQADSDYELMRAQVEQAPIPPREFKGEIPLAVEAAILQALEKDPSARFHSAAEFRRTLISAVPAAALKSEPIHPVEAEPALKATRVAGSEMEWQSVESDSHELLPRRDSGFDRTTGTFTLKLPLFVLTARQSLEAKVGPLNWKHYGGAAAAILAVVFGVSALRDNQPEPPKPEPPQPVVVLPTATPMPVQPMPEIPAVVPNVAPSGEEANVRPEPKAVAEEKALPRAHTASTAAPKPSRPQVANNDRAQPVVKPTPTPLPSQQAQQAQATPKPSKAERAIDLVGKGAETAGKVKDAVNKFNPFRRKN